MNPVATGCRANVKHRVADASRFRAHHFAFSDQSQAERVDENIGVVRGVEHHFACDGRHTHAIAVTANPADHAAEQVPRAQMVERSELERVHARDRPRAHRKNVAQDSADPGRRALVRLHERRMVMAFDFKDRRPAVADVDRTGVLARPLHHELALRRQLSQMDARRFVRAMLRPHDRENAELGVGRSAPDDLLNFAILVRRQAERAGLLDIDFRLAR